jgi:Cu-Zn family superoxide dismutase
MHSAVAVFQNKIKGSIRFTKVNDLVRIDVNIVSGLKPNQLQGFHIHEYGDLTDGCASACAHFNPFKRNHGCPGMLDRHVGDLGNIQGNANGGCRSTLYDDQIKIDCNSPAGIIGRSVVIHEDQDDCGLGGYPDSRTTGHAGKRVDCAVIGISN